MTDEQRILRARARALAGRADERTSGEQAQEVLRWQRGAHRFALPLSSAMAVVPVGQLAAVPHARPPLAGIGGFRGGLVPVYEPAPLLGATTTAPAPAGWGLILDGKAPLVLLADSLPRLQPVTPEELVPPGEDLPADARRCVLGVHRSGWVLLDPESVRSDARLTSSPVAPRPETRP